MSNIEPFPVAARRLSEFEALVAAAPSVLEAIPGAVYLCDRDGTLVRYNSEAAEIWGREPDLESGIERFCGSHRLYTLDGRFLPHPECPMAAAVQAGIDTRNAEVMIERPDGSRVIALINIRAIRDKEGNVQGAINCFQDISARKAIEEENLRKSKDLEDFFENGAIGLHIVNAEGIILRANRAELELLGYDADEYIGRHVAEFHADAPVIGDILHRLSCGEKLHRCPARLRAKDGSIRHVLITSNSRFTDGKFVSTRCFTTDVTGWREAELALRESDERLAATYEAATVGIAEADENGRFVRVNDAFCKIFGRTRVELLASDLIEITFEEDREREAALYKRQTRGELPSYFTRKRALRPDGSIAHLQVSSSTVRDEHGQFRYAVRVLQDVTDQQVMQEEIRASERRLREILEALPAATYTTDRDGRITFFNEACVELAGQRPQLGSDFWCVTWRLHWPHGGPMRHDECPMAIALKEGRQIRGAEAVAERPDGTRVPFLAYPTPLRDTQGRVVGAINMLIDISSRKEAEARQKALIDELNHRVKNTLATVQSLAIQTARNTTEPGDFAASFEARLIALAKVHDLLTKHHWVGASLHSLVEDIVAPFGESGRIRIEGPWTKLNARAAFSLAMVLNELATNATKYGSLSNESGNLLIDWELRQDAKQLLVIEWRERGGPEVVAPRRSGFGTRLMQRCIERDLNGEFDLTFDASGVQCRMALPLSVQAADA